MKAFVTGSTGLLGSNLVHALIDADYEVKALVRSTEKAQKILGHLDIEFVKGDMLNVDAFAAEVAGCDVLFHCAAYFREYYSSGEHENLLEKINVDGTINILNAAEKQGVKKTIYVSSGGVIGQAEKVIEDIRRLRDEYGVNDVLVAPWRGPSHQDVLKSLERFAREVMPALQENGASA